MKVKEGYGEWCYSLFNDGFWYSLTDGTSIDTTDKLHLEEEEDAQRVLEALNVLKGYAAACEALSEQYQEEEGHGYEEGEDEDDQ